jgi:uncharacterized membrane protein YcaP (DUF421 family)
MKVFVITLALAGLASAATVDAQISTNRLPTTNSSIGVDGTWRVVGRDGNGYTIYERRTQDRYGNIVVQRARREANGNMTIISSQNVGNTNNGNGNNCNYNRSTNSIGDIIFGRTNDVNCNDNGNRIDGGWYQVGRGRDNNSIYERRTRDRNGNLVIQRARRNSNGSMTIISTRYANQNDNQWRKDQKQQDKEWKKQQKQQNKGNRGNDNENSNYQNGNYQNDNTVYRGNDNSYRSDNSKGNGKGKGNDKGKHKGDK